MFCYFQELSQLNNFASGFAVWTALQNKLVLRLLPLWRVREEPSSFFLLPLMVFSIRLLGSEARVASCASRSRDAVPTASRMGSDSHATRATAAAAL